MNNYKKELLTMLKMSLIEVPSLETEKLLNLSFEKNDDLKASQIIMNNKETSFYQQLYDLNKNNLDKIAIKSLTFDKLFQQIDKMARAYLEAGIKPKNYVSICVPDTVEEIIAFYAANKIGAIANLLYPLSSEERIKLSLNETNSKLLISTNLCFNKIDNIIDETSVEQVVIVSSENQNKIFSCPDKESKEALLFNGISKKLKKELKKGNEYISWEYFMRSGFNYDEDVTFQTEMDSPAAILQTSGLIKESYENEFIAVIENFHNQEQESNIIKTNHNLINIKQLVLHKLQK